MRVIEDGQSRAWRVTFADGSVCHFGHYALAKAAARKAGKIDVAKTAVVLESAGVKGEQAMNEPTCMTCGGPHFTEHHNNSVPYNLVSRKMYTAADLAAAEAAAYRMGMDAGRKERTVEIYTLADECWVQNLIMEQYPECFECGCRQLGETKCSSCDGSIPLPECAREAMKDGGSAYPINTGNSNPDSPTSLYPEKGMSLRDHFAGAAMQAILYGCTADKVKPWEIAADAYKMADSMLAEREKP